MNTHIFKANIECLKGLTCPEKWPQLFNFLWDRLSKPSDLHILKNVVQSWPNFYQDLLPFIWEQAQKQHSVSASLCQINNIVLSQQECLHILSAGFLCLFDRDSYDWEDYPSINFERLFASTYFFDSETPKLQMLLQYFQTSMERQHQNHSLNTNIQFSLLKHDDNLENWCHLSDPMLPLVMANLREPIENARDCLRVDFANAYLGGASLSYGNVQEEIMFSLCPEMNAGRLFSKRMKEGEAILIVGPKRFSECKGYGGSLEFVGPFTPPPDEPESFTVAIDALDFRYFPPQAQYHPEAILRELNKSYAAFSAPKTPSKIATGNWGCGVFGGDVELKILIQWISAARAKKELFYHPFEQKRLYEEIPPLIKLLTSRPNTLKISDVLSFLLSLDPEISVLSQFKDFVHKF